MSDYAIVATTTRLCQHPLCQLALRLLHRHVQARSLSSAAAPARARADDPPHPGQYHRSTMATPGLFYLPLSLRAQTNAAIQCLTTPMYCSIDASTGGGEGLDAIRIVSDRFSNRYGHLPRRHTRRIAASTGGLYADAIGAMQNTATPTSIRLSFDCAKTTRRHSGRRRDAEYHTAYSPNPKEGKG